MVDTDLVNYIQDAISKGYTKEEIKKILLENDWSEEEVNAALSLVAKRMAAQTVKSQTATQTSISADKDKLVTFIEGAIAKGASAEDIKSALRNKGWPDYTIGESFKTIELKKKPKEEPEEVVFKPQAAEGLSKRIVLSYLVSFILITLVVSATVSLLFYVIAITNYEVVDPNTGENVKGACLEEKCADMKRFAFMEIGLHPDSQDRSKLWTSIIIGGISALAIVLAFYFVSFKTTLLWIINTLYFIFISYIAYLWIKFNYLTLS